MPLSRTFTINPKGQIQKASTAVQSSTWSSLSAINDLVDEMFPPLAAALHDVAGRVSRSLHATCSSTYFDTLELATSLGVVQQDTVAAALEEHRRRRGSITGGSFTGGSFTGGSFTGAGPGLGTGVGVTPAVAAGVGGEASSEGSAEQQPAAGSPTAGAAAGASDSKVESTGGADAAGTGAAAAVAAPVVADNTPTREEYNDLHFWRAPMLVDIGDELLQMSSSKQHPQQAS